MRILLDTNVLIAGIAHNGTCREAIFSVRSFHEIYCTEFIVQELEKVLPQKFGVDEFLTSEIISAVKKYFIFGKASKNKEHICRDSNDNQLLADALLNKIDLIITGDKDQLTLKHYKGVKIISPRQYLEQVENSRLKLE